MTTLLPIRKPISQLQLEPGSRITIPEVTWEEFEAILAELGERRSASIAYCHNTLEITVPRPDHELPTDLICDIVKAILRTLRQRYQPFGSTTFKQQGIAGIEPDACFYIQNYERMIGRRQLQAGDPPPDLAIETDVTSLTAIEAYQAIAVPEVWIYANEGLKIYVLRAGNYVQSAQSLIFPQLPIVEWVDRAIDRAWTVGSLQALEEVEDSLRNFIP
jgi:Uma2 family endonuclease